MEVIRERYLQKIRPFYGKNLIKVITGVRRCGKSVLLNQIKQEFIDDGTPNDHVIFVNFEDLNFEKIRNAPKLNDYIQGKIVDENEYKIFLDEIQHVKNFEKVLNSLRSTINCDIYITGSNSKLLSGKMATLLVGRCIEFRVLPFSFSEACEYLDSRNRLYNQEEAFYDYLKWGGMPLRFSFTDEKDIARYLTQTFEGILDKDIISNKVNFNRQLFEKLASYVMANAGKEFSASNIATYFNNNNLESIDRKTIYRYLDRMEKACLIDRVKRYNISGKKNMSYTEKQYAVDTGFRITNTNNIDFEETFYLENIIYNELVSRDYKVFVGKTFKGEIDFVVTNGRAKSFIQVAYLLASRRTIEREFGAFDNIKDSAPKYVLSLDKVDFSRDGIGHINIIDFLLGKKDIALT